MAAFFQKILGWIIGPILNWIGDKISSAIQKYRAMKEAEKKVKDANQQVLDQTLKAQTKEERDRAAEEIIKHL